MYLDESGMVLPRSISHRLFDLPMISGISESEPLALGSIIRQPDVIEALQLLATMKTVNRPMYHNVSEVQVRNGVTLSFILRKAECLSSSGAAKYRANLCG